MTDGARHDYRRALTNAVTIVWILVKLTLVSALLSPSVREVIYAGF